MSKISINIKGVDFNVEYIFIPAEKEVPYYADGSGYPGYPESVEINDIKHKGTSFMDFFEDQMTMVEEMVLDQIRTED